MNIDKLGVYSLITFSMPATIEQLMSVVKTKLHQFPKYSAGGNGKALKNMFVRF